MTEMSAAQKRHSDIPLTLIGQVRRFGTHGIVYEVIAPASDNSLRIRVIETGEILDYPLAKVLADPRH